MPVSAKLRLGFDSDDSMRICKAVEDAGAEFLTLHGRAVCQKYSGKSDWAAIWRVAEELAIPVIANGDAKSEGMAIEMLKLTGAHGVMLGRATRGRPDMPGTARDMLESGEFETMAPDTLVATTEDHAELECRQFGERSGIRRMRKHVHWYLSAAGVGHDADLAHRLETKRDLDEFVENAVARR